MDRKLCKSKITWCFLKSEAINLMFLSSLLQGGTVLIKAKALDKQSRKHNCGSKFLASVSQCRQLGNTNIKILLILRLY